MLGGEETARQAKGVHLVVAISDHSVVKLANPPGFGAFAVRGGVVWYGGWSEGWGGGTWGDGGGDGEGGALREVSSALSKQLLHGRIVLPVQNAKLVKTNVWCTCVWCVHVCVVCMCVCCVHVCVLCAHVCVYCVHMCVCIVCTCVCVCCVDEKRLCFMTEETLTLYRGSPTPTPSATTGSKVGSCTMTTHMTGFPLCVTVCTCMCWLHLCVCACNL